MSGRRAKQHRRITAQARPGTGAVRVLWTERLAAVGLLTSALVPFIPTAAFALPEGGVVAAGAATITNPTATSMQINQTTDRAILDWTRFNIAANEAVRFQQPSAVAIALNRVSGQEPSAIFGSLSANGQIFLLNPSGILFGASSRVDVGALTASTLTMSNQDFLAGQYRFTQDPDRGNTAVVNQGLITAGPGGYVALLGAAARNEGMIQAQLGSIALASGKAATLDMRGDGLIQFVITDAVSGSVNGPDGQPLTSAVSNTGTLQADGGMVTLQARAAAGLVRSVVNQEGLIRATSLVNHGGVIKLVADGENAIAWNKGVLDVSAGEPGAGPGSVTMSAPYAGQSGTILATGADGSAGGRVEITSTEQSGLFANSLIDVSGLGNADGGSVRVWSDNYTVFSSSATILALGGTSGGNGGFVEVSGKEALNVAGLVDARAPYGATGTLLLDPHNIIVATGGVGLLTDVDQFADTPATDVTIAPATINAAGANVVLQANNDITFTNAVSIAGAGISLTAQAGRSIIINANVTTNNAPVTFTANETAANGTQDGNRDVGAAVITMAAATTIASGGSDINITLIPGAGLTNATSGNITLQGINAGVGNVLIANRGPTAGSAIVRASASQLITATSAALDVNSAGGGGGIGTSGSPIRVTVTNLEARSQTAGGFFTSPTLTVNIGGAILGGLTGISTSSNAAVSVTTTASTITTTEAISANGTGTVTLTAAGAASALTLNDAITSGSGAMTLTAANGITLSGANADVTTTGAYTANADSDSNGTGAYTQNNAGSAVASGTVIITAADIDLQGTINAGVAAVTVRPGLLAATIGVEDTSKNFNLTNAELSTITTTGTVTIGQTTNTGGITIGTDGAINQTKILTFTTAGPLSLGPNGLTTTGAVSLTTTSAITPITLTGSINAGSAAITLTAANGITLSGANADVTTTGAYTANADSDSNGTGVYSQTNAGSAVATGAVTISAQDISLVGTINAGTTAVILRPGLLSETIGVEDASKQFSLTNAELTNITTTGTLTIGRSTNTGTITIGTDTAVNQGKTLTFLNTGNIVLAANGLTNAGTVTMTTSGIGAITLDGPLATTGDKAIAVTTTNGAITTNGTINAAGSGTINVFALGAVNGILTVNNTITSGSGAIELVAFNGMTLSGAAADVTTTGTYTARSDNDGTGTGAYIQNAGSAVSSGTVLITAQDITLDGTIDAGAAAVTLRPVLASETIGIEDASKQFSLTNAELNNITTTGTLTIGRNTNTGTMTIGTDTAVNQGKTLTFLNTGNIVLAANGLTTAGAVTMTTSGTGAITIDGSLATTGDNNIRMTTANASITTNGTINAAGSGTINLTARGAANGITVNNALTSGSDSISLTAANGITLSGANADITTTGAYTVDADSDSNGTGDYSQNNAGSDVSSGAVTITAADIDLQGLINAGAADVTLMPSPPDESVGIGDIAGNFNISNAEIGRIITTGTLVIGGTSGNITVGTNEVINAGTKNVELRTTGILTVSAANGISTTGDLIFSADDMNLNGGSINGGNVTLRPASAVTTIGIEDDSQLLSLTNTELNTISTAGILTIGIASNTGGINIAVDGPVSLGNINVSFITGGSILIGTHNLTTTGNVTLSAGAAGTPLALDWEFAEASGATATDLSGNGNAGTLVSNPIRLAGGILQFDGTNHVVVNPIANFPGDEVSVEFLMRTTDAANDGTPVSYATSANENEVQVTDYSNFTLSISQDATVGPSTGVSANDGNWHHIAMSWRSVDGQLTLYKDGTEVFVASHSRGASLPSGGSFMIAQDQDCVGGCLTPVQAFKGDIDFVRVWHRALSTAEVQQLAADPNSYTSLFSAGTITSLGGSISAGSLTEICNGTPCNLPLLSNNLLGLSPNARFLLGAKPEDGTLLTAGVLPDHIYGCLNKNDDAVICTADAIWQDDDGADRKIISEAVPLRDEQSRPPVRGAAAFATNSPGLSSSGVRP